MPCGRPRARVGVSARCRGRRAAGHSRNSSGARRVLVAAANAPPHLRGPAGNVDGDGVLPSELTPHRCEERIREQVQRRSGDDRPRQSERPIEVDVVHAVRYDDNEGAIEAHERVAVNLQVGRRLEKLGPRATSAPRVGAHARAYEKR